MAKLILVIEDCDSIRELMVEVLTEEGYHPTGVKTSIEAVELLDHIVFDIITLDLQLPDMDGNQFLKKIEEHISAAPAVIVVSANPQHLKPHPLVKAVIGKPFDIQQLIAVLKKYLD